jgi:predicted chitinase
MEKKLFISLLGTLLLLAYPNDCSPENTGLWTTEIILQTLDTGDLSEEQMALMREELEIYQKTLEPLMKADMEAWKKKISELLRKLAQGFKIYNLVHKNPDLKIKVDSFTRKTNIEVYIFPYVEDAFLNNIFQRLAEARYDIFKRAHLKMRYKFKKASTDSSNKFTVKLQLVYDSALVALLKDKLASGYKDYSDLSLEASANKDLQKAGIQDIFSDAASTNTGVDPTAEDILDKLASANVEAVDEEPDYLSVMICDSIVKNGKVYYWTKDCLLKVKMDNKDPENVKEINLGLTINISNPKSVKTYSYIIKDFINWNTLKVDSLPEGKYTLVATINKKSQSKTFYLRKTKSDYACVKCGRDLKYTGAKLISMFPNATIIEANSSTVANLFNNGFKKMKINTCLMHAQFLAQCQHESGNFKSKEESYNYYLLHMLAVFKNNTGTEAWFQQSFWDNKTYLNYVGNNVYEQTDNDGAYDMDQPELDANYQTVNWKGSATQLIKVPYHYPVGKKYANKTNTYKKNSTNKGKYKLKTFTDDEKLANGTRLLNDAYRGMNGNSNDANSNDGFTYKGRGIIQITGKGNYLESQNTCNKTFTPTVPFNWKENPEHVERTDDMVYSAFGWLYNKFKNNIKELHTLDVNKISEKVNSASEGLSERTSNFNKLHDNYFYDCSK